MCEKSLTRGKWKRCILRTEDLWLSMLHEHNSLPFSTVGMKEVEGKEEIGCEIEE